MDICESLTVLVTLATRQDLQACRCPVRVEDILVYTSFLSGKCDLAHHRHSADILCYFSSLFVDYYLVLYISGFLILILQILLPFYIGSIT